MTLTPRARETRSAPVRTCVACAQRAPQHALMRLTAVPAGEASIDVVPDHGRRREGRGVYVHRSDECMTLLLKRRPFRRRLRIPAASAAQLVMNPTLQAQG